VTRVVLDLYAEVRYWVSKVGDPARMIVELSRPPAGIGPAQSVSMGTDVQVQWSGAWEELFPTPRALHPANLMCPWTRLRNLRMLEDRAPGAPPDHTHPETMNDLG